MCAQLTQAGKELFLCAEIAQRVRDAAQFNDFHGARANIVWAAERGIRVTAQTQARGSKSKWLLRVTAHRNPHSASSDIEGLTHSDASTMLDKLIECGATHAAKEEQP